MAQTTQLQQAAPPPSSVGAGTAAPAAAGAAQAQPPPVAATTPVSNPSTPQPPSSNNNNNNNNNNSVVSPAGNNNNNVMAAPVHAFTPAGQPIYNLCTPMPAHGGHPHAGGHYAATMLQAPISSSVYVNQVTANVNLHGWSHSVPAYIPGAGQAHYMPHGDMPQDQQGNPLMQQLQQVPINLATQGVSPNQHNPNMGGRGRLRGRGGRGGPRRNDYHPRHLQQQQQQQQQLIPLPPQQQLQQDSAGAGAPNMQLQPEHQLVAGPPDGQMQPVPYYPHPYTYGPYPAAYFAPQHAALQAPPNAGAAAAAQQVTGPPIYMPFMYPNAMYNCMGGYVYQHLIPQPEYPYVPEDGSQPGGVDERGQQPDGGMPQIWHPGPMYAEEYADVLQQQQQQQQQQQVSNPNGAPGLGDELNHNNFSLPSSETGSMLSPSCSVYEASIHEMQHQMGVMQIYDDGQMASLQTIHPGAGPVQQYVDELAECVVGPPGAIPVEWAAPIPMAGPAGMLPPPPQWQAGQEWQQPPTVAIEQQQQPQMIQPQPPQAPTPTPQQQPPHQDQLVVEKNLMNNNNEVPLEEILSNEKQQQIEMEYQQQQQQPQQQQQQPQVRTYGTMKVPSSPVASNAPLLERKNSQQGGATVAAAATTTSTASITATPSHFQQQETSNATATAAAPQQQQQSHYHQQQQQQPQPATQQQYAAPPAAATKTYSSYAAKRQHTVYEQPALSSVVSASASSSTSANTQPQLNLAPPAPPASQSNQNSSESSQPSWASLFANKKPVAKVAPYEANKPTPAPAPLPVLPPVQQLAPPQPQLQAPPKPQLKPQPQLQPQPKLQPLLPAPTAHQQLQLPAPVPAPITPLITPGTLSYSAASAQAMPAPSPSASIKPLKPEPVARPAAQLDEWTNKYADFLTRQKTNLAPISLRPRGLTNRSNYCYINSILQALLGCSPFYNLLRSIPKQAAVLSDVKTPTVNAMMSFMTNFSSLPSGLRLRLNTLNKAAQNKGKDEFAGTDLQCDIAFEPTDIYKLWNDSREEHVEGRQEDAEEFLGYVLNKLNDEMLEVIKLIAKPVPQQNGQEQPEPEDGGEVWQMICNNRNKGSVTRQTDFGRTPISDIFRGELRSRLQREGEHSTDVIQPFFTLQLNIEKAASVKEALEILVGRDQLEGVTGSKTKQEVVAWQQMTLEKLPVVLILHLKYFDYRSDGCTKILKKVEFPAELKIDAKILGSKKISQKQRAYRLFAVVYHDGKEASKGHYITDVFHTGYNNWLRYDDSSVKPISEKQVLQPHTPRVPYLLYYRRSDTIQHTTQPHQQQANGGGASGGVVGGSTSNSDANK
ncbi:trithorax group protein osa isoform X3 [Drosophila subobscura]|uniref:trithorax group protein osa isoform X3 n=1 Tax=Drosophila subobscura TaxID=7241 RepID=UPI00155A2FA5|nr:trithorax group protein osa isoform X3 [Drosophila subobscura]